MVDLLKGNDIGSIKRINQLKKNSVYVTEDIVAGFVIWCGKKNQKVVCAFMEAEWELIRLESDGIIDGIVSEDSDCLVLGCKLAVQLLSKTVNPLEPNCSFVYGTSWYDFVHKEMIDSPSISERADLAVLMGCDYLDRVHGNSVLKIKTCFSHWRVDREKILDEIELSGQVGGKRTRNGLQGFTQKFKNASNIFQHAPCYIVSSPNVDLTARDSFWSDDYGVYRGNIRTLPDDVNEYYLFGFTPDDHLPISIQLKDMFTAVVWIRTSLPFVQHLISPPRNIADQILPWGCHLDFDKVSVHMQPTRALICYLESRGLSPRSTNTRQQIDSAVLRVVSQGALGPAIIPSTASHDSGHYVNAEYVSQCQCGHGSI